MLACLETAKQQKSLNDIVSMTFDKEDAIIELTCFR